ncbi:hypothetical protein V6N12_057034 [Hibiscus sabdariffa]|uniref:Uncharacterized protein n=1 Tax=Hibiscus sabdariffa TaxID=183260 RepID=A0ABR2DCS3_9ROSI
MPPNRFLVSARVIPPIRHLASASVSPPARLLRFGQDLRQPLRWHLVLIGPRVSPYGYNYYGPKAGPRGLQAASVTSATVKTNESKEFSIRKNKSALMQEGREAIKASMKRNMVNPFELKRLSPGGPDPHHH